jgi:hypothetical protein
MKLASLSATVLLFAVGTVVHAASPYELVVASSKSAHGANGIAFDVMSDGTATGLEIRVNLGVDKSAKVDTSRCASALPASHQGSCVFNGKELVILVYSTINELLPSGSIDLGTVYYSGSASGMAKGPVVSSFIAGSPDGKPVGSSVFSDVNDDSRSLLQK